MGMFDDFIWYEPKKNKIWIGRRDTKWSNEPWSWWIISNNGGYLRGKVFGPPNDFVEIAREPEMTICGGPREL